MSAFNGVVYARAEAIPNAPSAPSVLGFDSVVSNTDHTRQTNSVFPVPEGVSQYGVQHSINEVEAREYLSGHKWPLGLQQTFISNLHLIPIRFFICDDSGSMIASDGHKVMTAPNGQQK